MPQAGKSAQTEQRLWELLCRPGWLRDERRRQALHCQQLNEAPFALIIPTTLLFWFLWSAAHSYPKQLPPGYKVKAALIEKQLGIVLFFLCASTAVNHS